jgi:hypothetical protein
VFVVSYYFTAAISAWGLAWDFARDRAIWSVPVTICAVMLVAMRNKVIKGFWRPDIWIGLAGAIGSPILVILAVFVYKFIIYFPERDAEQQKELQTLRSSTTPAGVPRKFTRIEIEVRQQAIRDLTKCDYRRPRSSCRAYSQAY